jgi:hypothetical protein
VCIAQDAVRLADQLGGEGPGGGALADTGRPVQEIGMRRAFGERRAEEALRLGLLRQRL